MNLVPISYAYWPPKIVPYLTPITSKPNPVMKVSKTNMGPRGVPSVHVAWSIRRIAASDQAGICFKEILYIFV